MADQQALLIIDIGTGNVRVAVAAVDGRILSIERENVQYTRDERYPDALYFEPEVLWNQIIALTRDALSRAGNVQIKAVTASSQREGIVLLDAKGHGIVGLPNHDHRGREWQEDVPEKNYIYSITGRYPSSLFSAMKVVGIKHKQPDLYAQLHTVVSISDWAQFKLSGIAGYEHSQASETQLYDIEKKSWSKDLCSLFGLSENMLPPLHASGTILGTVLPQVAKDMSISSGAVVVVGGADTQLAIKSTQPALEDIVIVSGTTTPIVKIIPGYVYDRKQRTWTNRHVDENSFILEANAGVTGLNYQRLKEIFYPNEGYDVIERELDAVHDTACIASLGSLVADEKAPMTKGGFIFDVPVSHQLTRAHFIRATLWDIACCIKENYDCLRDVTTHESNFVWACGGGFQSPLLRQYIADLLNKRVRIRSGFHQASVSGGIAICCEALKIPQSIVSSEEEIVPRDHKRTAERYHEWKEIRAGLKESF